MASICHLVEEQKRDEAHSADSPGHWHAGSAGTEVRNEVATLPANWSISSVARVLEPLGCFSSVTEITCTEQCHASVHQAGSGRPPSPGPRVAGVPRCSSGTLNHQVLRVCVALLPSFWVFFFKLWYMKLAFFLTLPSFLPSSLPPSLSFWLRWVFVAVRGISLVVMSGGFSCCGARALGARAQ